VLSDIRKVRNAMRISPLHINAILMISVFLYRTRCVLVEVIANYRLSIQLCSSPNICVFKCFFVVYSRSVRSGFVFKNKKRKAMGKEMEDPVGSAPPIAENKN